MKAQYKAAGWGVLAVTLAAAAVALVALYGVTIFLMVKHGDDLEAEVEQTSCTVLAAEWDTFSCCLTGTCGCQQNYVCHTKVAYEVNGVAYQQEACSFSPTCCEVNTGVCEENNCTQATDETYSVDSCYTVLAVDVATCQLQEGATVTCWVARAKPAHVALTFDPAFTGDHVLLSILLLLFVGIWVPLALLYGAVVARRRARLAWHQREEHRRLVTALRSSAVN